MERLCPQCNGKGKVLIPKISNSTSVRYYNYREMICDYCLGRGYVEAYRSRFMI